MAMTYIITGEALYRMHRLKRELAEKRETKTRRSKWFVAATVAAIYILVWG
jgi:hypothetical protein